MLGKTQSYHAESDAVVTVPDESAVSSMSDLSTGNKRIRRRQLTTFATDQTELTEIPTMIRSASSTAGGGLRHNKSECLLCCRIRVMQKIADTSLNIQEPKENLISMNGKIRDSDVSFYSPESIVSDDSANTNMPDRISNVILRNCQKMANPILFKNCRKILMELKQKYPQSFQDLCLYSEVCKFMGSCNYRMTVRRFIQEIFLDLNYDQLFPNNDIELISSVARQRLSDLKLLDSSKTFPTSPPPHVATSSAVQLPQAISQHKIHSLKSPLLASVYETSIENLIDSPLKVEELPKDEVDARTSPVKKLPSPSGSAQQVKAEVHTYRHSSIESRAAATSTRSDNTMQPIRR